MATVAAGAGAGPAFGAAAERPRFWLWMAIAIVAIAFTGFLPSYWQPLAAGRFAGQPIMHIHGALFFGWTLLYLTQTALVGAGQVKIHRGLGMVGIALIGMMMFSVPVASINSMFVADRISPAAGDLARQFSAVPLTGMVTIAGLFTVAIANVRRADVHKRFMFMMQIGMVQAAAGRVVAALLTPPGTLPGTPPPGAFVSVPAGIAVDLLLVAGMIYDRRTLGHVHWAYKVGVPIVLAQQLLVVPISTSGWWMAFARALQGLVR